MHVHRTLCPLRYVVAPGWILGVAEPVFVLEHDMIITITVISSPVPGLNAILPLWNTPDELILDFGDF